MKNEQFENDIKVVPVLPSKLAIVEIDGEQILKGELDIIDSNGRLWDTYQIEIIGSDNYPYGFPKLFETTNAFPKIADWHVYENDESCCIDVPPSEIIICKLGLNVVDYIQQFAVPYFANQTFRIREGYYRYGEYSHGIFGRIEFYQKKLKAKNPAEFIEMFRLILNNYNPSRTAYCPFCHKVKFRHCHRDVFRELQNVKAYLYNDGLQLIPFFRACPDYRLPTG